MSGRDFLEPKVEATPQSALLPRIDGIRVGELVGIADNCTRPLVVYPGQPGTAAIPARSIPDLRGEHIGRQAENAWPLDDKPAQVEVDTDGERLVVSAKEEIVLRCGAASITLTKAGKVLIRGTYVLSRSSGVNRVKGGSVQLN